MSMVTAQPKRLRSKTTRPAYTLVELLVVMAALTVLAAVTLPSLKSLMHDQKVTAASRMVKAHFQAAQSRAIASNSPVAVIMERSGDGSASDLDVHNTVSRLSIGQVFPPYEGDTTGTTGELVDSPVTDNFYDTLRINVGEAILLAANAAVFGPGDFLQLDDRQSTYLIKSITVTGAVAEMKFDNPSQGQEGNLQVDTRLTNTARFRIFRKPTKSFLQTLTLPRGTCIDLSVSGFGQRENNLIALNSSGPALVVFNSMGRIAYWSNGANGVNAATSLLHVLVGRTEQVHTNNLMSLANPDDTSTFNANVNDNANAWLTVNPFTGAITSTGLQAGDEEGTFGDRLNTARSFATYGINQSEN